MANRTTRKVVCCNINVNFFDKVLEPSRKSLEKKLGVPVTQSKFTEFLAKNNAKFIISNKSKNDVAKQLFGKIKPRRRK